MYVCKCLYWHLQLIKLFTDLALSSFVSLTEEAKAAAEESNQSPVIGKRNESTASPIQSRGSGTSETWPAQSDEDIDRLVAMHQNRDSLSSLGVSRKCLPILYNSYILFKFCSLSQNVLLW